jgi:predicted RNase H-like HicB family nuclease
MNYTYGCALVHEDDGWIATFPQLGGYATEGDTCEEALHNAHDLLCALLCDYAERGEEPPTPKEFAAAVPVSVQITPEVVEESHYETLAACAELLGLPRDRVEALIETGQLEGKVFDGQLEVSIESMNRWRASNGKAGGAA